MLIGLLLLSTTTSATEPDGLGGVVLQELIPAGVAWQDPATAYIDTEVAGQAGRLFIDQCDGRASTVRFRMGTADNQDVLKNVPWAKYGTPPLKAGLLRMQQLGKALLDSGWAVQSNYDRKALKQYGHLPYFPTGVDRIAFTTFARSGVTRTLYMWCKTEVFSIDPPNWTSVCIEELVVDTGHPCHSGL